jgi:hypothetical protein
MRLPTSRATCSRGEDQATAPEVDEGQGARGCHSRVRVSWIIVD